MSVKSKRCVHGVRTAKPRAQIGASRAAAAVSIVAVKMSVQPAGTTASSRRWSMRRASSAAASVKQPPLAEQMRKMPACTRSLSAALQAPAGAGGSR